MFIRAESSCPEVWLLGPDRVEVDTEGPQTKNSFYPNGPHLFVHRDVRLGTPGHSCGFPLTLLSSLRLYLFFVGKTQIEPDEPLLCVTSEWPNLG